MKINLKKIGGIVLCLVMLGQNFATYAVAFSSDGLAVIASPSAEKDALSQLPKDESLDVISSQSGLIVQPTLDTGNAQQSARFRGRIRVLGLLKRSFQARESIKVTLQDAKDTYFKITFLDKDSKRTPVKIIQSENGQDEDVMVTAPSDMKPGKYIMRVEDSQGIVSEQSFTWGVLALNPDQSMYKVGETASFALAVLDEKGEIVCDAQLALAITDPQGNKKVLSTNDKSIKPSSMCGKKELTLIPDLI